MTQSAVLFVFFIVTSVVFLLLWARAEILLRIACRTADSRLALYELACKRANQESEAELTARRELVKLRAQLLDYKRLLKEADVLDSIASCLEMLRQRMLKIGQEASDQITQEK